MELVYLLGVVAVLVLYRMKDYIRSVYLALNLKGPSALPLLGNVLLINDGRRLEELGTNASQLYGAFFRSWISIIPFIWIYEPGHLKTILGSSKNSEKNIFYSLLHNFVGDGLVTNNGRKWKRHRKLIQPCFHINVLEMYTNIFTESARDFLKKLEGRTDVNVTSFINSCVLDIQHKAVLGVPVDFDGRESPYRKGEVLLTQRVSKPWLLLESIFRHTPFAEMELKQKLSLHSYTKNILLKRKSERKSSPTKCLLDMLIDISEKNSNFTDNDVINEAVTFMLTGQDSVGGAMAFTLFYLAKHQTVQKKILQELDSINADNGGITVSDLNRMKYLEQCIKESLRLAPSIPVISRVLTEDIVLDGRVFPKGTNIFISPFITHRLPHLFPEPLKFDPDRFGQENIDNIHPYAFIPFSIGPRNCIGYKFAMLEMKTIIAVLLRKYELTSTPGHEQYKISYRATLRAKGGIWLHLKPRV